MKRLTGIFFFLAVFLALMPVNVMASGSKTVQFSDVKDTDYYFQAATALEQLEILTGYPDGTFKAEKSITRAEMAAVVCRMIDKEADAEKSKGQTAFDDVSDSHWASGYINVASERGIINGDGNGKFRPEDNVKHEEALKMVICALGYGDNIEGTGKDWSKGYLEAADEKGISKGLKGTKGNASTRGDVAVITYNGLVVDLAVPTVSLDAGSYRGPQNIELATAAKNAEIHYTVDGSIPTADSTKYSGAVTVSETCTLKAAAIKSGVLVSDLLSVDYVIEPFTGGSAPSVYSLTFSEAENGSIITESGNYKAGQTVEIEAIPDEGYLFIKWESSDGGTFEDNISEKTTFTMPENNVEIKAVFADHIENKYAPKRFTNSIVLMANASYENDMINVFWSTTLYGDRYTLYKSADGSSFEMIAENIEERSYDVNVSGLTSDIFFKVVQMNENEQAESNIVKMVYTDGVFTEEVKDTDSDGVSDYVEDIYGIDTEIADTDNDGLTDYQEIHITFTEPLLVDTDFDGINDGEEDFDNDGLSNVTEIAQDTNPFDADTDSDGLSDNGEISVHKTKPTASDTDYDGLSDSMELTLGTDPLNADTNGNGILDGNEKYSMTADIEEYDPSTKPTLEITAGGHALDTLHIQKTNPEYIMTSDKIPGYIGCGYDFYMNGNFDKATLTIEFDEALLEDENFNPVIYYIDEENQQMVELETKVTGNSATAELEHFSAYILINKTEFDKLWEKEIKPPVSDEEFEAAALDVMFVIDYSLSMKTNDPKQLFKTVSKEFIEKLRDGKDKAGAVKFIRKADIVSALTTNRSQVINDISGIRYDNGYNDYSGTDGSTGIKMALEQLAGSESKYQYIVFITDGGDNQYTHPYEDLIEEAKALSVNIYTIGMASSSESLLRKIAEETGGKYYYTAIDSFEEVFEDIELETIDITTDSDKDGISDYYEEKLILFNGVSVNLDKNNPDCDNDGLLDGEELVVTVERNRVYGKLISSPFHVDTDLDQIEDAHDSTPLKMWIPYTKLGEIVDYAGFSYDAGQDILYSKINPRQYNWGYCYFYDEGIFFISSLLDCEPIYFLYDGKEWMIELWKGQYGIETGGEIGIYNRSSSTATMAQNLNIKSSNVISDFLIRAVEARLGSPLPNWFKEEFRKVCNEKIKIVDGVVVGLSGILSWINNSEIWSKTDNIVDTSEVRKLYGDLVTTISSCLTSKMYACAVGNENENEDEWLKMSSNVKYDGKEQYNRYSSNHWWLTGFKWGDFTEDPNNISMDISITFDNEQMKEAFLYGKSVSDPHDYSQFTNSIKDFKDHNNDNDGNYGLLKIGGGKNPYKVTENVCTVNLTFSKPKSSQTVTRALFEQTVQFCNKKFVNMYNELKKSSDITTNDPNVIDTALRDVKFLALGKQMDEFYSIAKAGLKKIFCIADAVVG